MKGLFRRASGAGVILCWFLLAVWLFSRAVSDRFYFSQYLFWVPTVAYLGAGLVLVVLSWLAAWAGGRANSASGRRRWAWGRWRLAAGIGLLLVGLYAALVEQRLQGYLFRPAPGGPTIRILNWNATNVDSTDQIIEAVTTQNPDLAILVNLTGAVRRRKLFDAFGPPLALVQDNEVTVMSRLQISRYGYVVMNLPGLKRGYWHGEDPDPGRALYLELDTTATLGRTTIVWVIDMPSDPRLSRRRLFAGAAAAVRGWRGTQIDRDTLGRYTVDPGEASFPEPDIILGDFNTPRGSGSISLLTGGLANAFDQGGRGWSASWPRSTPVFHIDQMFLAPWLRAWGYRVVDPPFGYHRMQVGEIGRR
jgi:hypothetical protein